MTDVSLEGIYKDDKYILIEGNVCFKIHYKPRVINMSKL